MSRRKTLPSLSSSRQMMMAWKVSGLSHRPAIIASRPASMRLAMAISPSRDSSSTEPISRRYMRTGSSVRSPGSDFLTRTAGVAAGPRPARRSVSSSSGSSRGLLLVLGSASSVSTDVDAHLVEHRENVLDLLGGHLLGRQNRVDLVMRDVAALLGALIICLTAASDRSRERQRASAYRRSFSATRSVLSFFFSRFNSVCRRCSGDAAVPVPRSIRGRPGTGVPTALICRSVARNAISPA